MKVRSHAHVYRFVPHFVLSDGKGGQISNRKLPQEEQIVILTSVIPPQDDEAYTRSAMVHSRKLSPEKAAEINEERFNAMLKKAFHGVEGLEVEGIGAVTDFEDFMTHAPRKIRDQFLAIVRDEELLSEGEQKNFVPESDTL